MEAFYRRIYGKSGNMLEMVQDRDIVTTDN